MRKFITLLVLGLLLSCSPMAKYVEYDVYDHIPIYGMDDTDDYLPPNDNELSEGESYVWYWGKVNRVYYIRRGHYSLVEVDKNGYFYGAEICGKTEIRNGTRCFFFKTRDNDTIKTYLINDHKKYMLMRDNL